MNIATRIGLTDLCNRYRPFIAQPSPTNVGEAVQQLAEAEVLARDHTLSVIVKRLRDDYILGPQPFIQEIADAVAGTSALAERMHQLRQMPSHMVQLFTSCAKKPFMKMLTACAAGGNVDTISIEKALLSCAVHALIETQQTGHDFSPLISFLAGVVSRWRARPEGIDLKSIARALFEGRLSVVGSSVVQRNR